MNYCIVCDSASDLLSLDKVAFTSVPLKIITQEKEYVDDGRLDVDDMIADLRKYKGISKSSCPNSGEWEDAFSDCDGIFCVTITSGLSGSYNAAGIAMKAYLAAHPEKRGMVIDTLSAGAEQALIVEKLQELICLGLTFDEISDEIRAYQRKTHLVFVLESLRNSANNGRVSSTVAKMAGLLGIRIIGKASDAGELEVTAKAKGSKRAYSELFSQMEMLGYSGAKVRIHHCQNPEGAAVLATMIQEKYPRAPICITKTRGLCSFYAENRGLLVGFEE